MKNKFNLLVSDCMDVKMKGKNMKYRRFKLGETAHLAHGIAVSSLKTIGNKIAMRKLYFKPDTPVSIIGFVKRSSLKSSDQEKRALIVEKLGTRFEVDPDQLYN